MKQGKHYYFDYAASTPVDPRVAEVMHQCLTHEGDFGNPSSRSHFFGWEAEKRVEKAREQVAEVINADPREIVFTSGATESSNLCIQGAYEFYHAEKGNHIITSSIEHKCVLNIARALEERGAEVTYLDPDEEGIISADKVKAAIKPSTMLVSIMHANNETGTVQPIEAIGKLCHENGILFHTDVAQTAGKIPIDVRAMHINMLSISGHKFYGPKGAGALFVSRSPRTRIAPIIFGGGQERGLRSGTLATHQIAGLGEAISLCHRNQESETAHMIKLRDKVRSELGSLDEVKINGSVEHCLPGTVNISFNYIEGESLMMSIKDLAVSSGSACSSASLEPSYVLRAMGLDDLLAHSSIRFSVGRFTTEEDVDYAIASIKSQVNRLRELSPLWDMYKSGVDLSTIQWNEH